jgi:hypothetical protein
MVQNILAAFWCPMIRHEYQTPTGPAYYWTPTEAEVREEVAANLSHMDGGWDLAEQVARPGRLEKWYALDGRHDSSHPLHGTFTGLAEIYGGKAPF